MFQQPTHFGQHVRRRAGRLQHKPLVHHQTILVPAFVKGRQQRVAARQLRRHRSGQSRQRIGHIIRLAILLRHQSVGQRFIAKGQVTQAHVAQRTFRDASMFNPVAVGLVSVINRQPLIGHFLRQTADDRFVHHGDRFRIDSGKQLGNFTF
ncbi:hypothetical protein D3C80_953960 [compost metagenome]